MKEEIGRVQRFTRGSKPGVTVRILIVGWSMGQTGHTCPKRGKKNFSAGVSRAHWMSFKLDLMEEGEKPGLLELSPGGHIDLMAWWRRGPAVCHLSGDRGWKSTWQKRHRGYSCVGMPPKKAGSINSPAWATNRRSRKPLHRWKTRIWLQPGNRGGWIPHLEGWNGWFETLQKGSARKERWWGVLGRVLTA